MAPETSLGARRSRASTSHALRSRLPEELWLAICNDVDSKNADDATFDAGFGMCLTDPVSASQPQMMCQARPLLIRLEELARIFGSGLWGKRIHLTYEQAMKLVGRSRFPMRDWKTWEEYVYKESDASRRISSLLSTGVILTVTGPSGTYDPLDDPKIVVRKRQRKVGGNDDENGETLEGTMTVYDGTTLGHLLGEPIDSSLTVEWREPLKYRSDVSVPDPTPSHLSMHSRTTDPPQWSRGNGWRRERIHFCWTADASRLSGLAGELVEFSNFGRRLPGSAITPSGQFRVITVHVTNFTETKKGQRAALLAAAQKIQATLDFKTDCSFVFKVNSVVVDLQAESVAKTARRR